MPGEKPPEVVVIGAGLGGLAAAYDLASSGVDVLVLERHNLPGGFATSFIRGRFEFETSLHEVAASPAVDFIKGLDGGMEFLPVPEAYRLLLTEKGTDFRAPFGPEAFTKAVSERAGGGAAGIKAFMDLCAETYEAFTYLGSTPRPSLKKVFGDYGNFLRTGAAVTDEVADAVGLTPEARDLIYPYWCYLGVPTDRGSFSIWASMVHSYLKFGAVIPRGRSHGIAAALASAIRAKGGRVRFNAEVTGIDTSEKRIAGIRLAGGERIGCGHVVSNVIPHRIFGQFIDPNRVPRQALKIANTRRHGTSFFVLYLGLDADREELGLTDYSYFIAPHMNTSELEAKFLNRHDPNPMQAAVCLNAADPGASPPGTAILSITVGTRPEAWSDVTPGTYGREKRRFAAQVIDQFERATGVRLRGHVEELETAAPPTFARYVGSWDGTVYGYESEPWDAVIPRVVSERRERFYRNLRFCGGNAFRAHGYGSALLSGRKAAEATMADMGR